MKNGILILLCFAGLALLADGILMSKDTLDDSKPTAQEAVVAIKKLSDLAAHKMLMSGNVEDDSGKPLADVTVTIKKLLIVDVLVKIEGKEESETRTLEDSKIKYEFKGWYKIIITFSKTGYCPGKKDLIVDSEESEKGYAKEDIKIVMRKIGEVDEGCREDRAERLQLDKPRQ